MNPFAQLGKTLIFLGAVLILVGGLLLLSGKIKGIGYLPGDIYIQKKNFVFYFPLATSVIISIILSLLIWIFSKK